MEERFWRRIKIARVHVNRRDARVFGKLRKLAQQRCLTHTARSINVQHLKRQFNRGERGLEKHSLFIPAHEPAPPRRADALSHTQRHTRTF